MSIDWNKIRWFVHRKTFVCTAAVMEEDGIRLFPIGSLRFAAEGQARYFEIFARPVPEGAEISFLAVDINPLFWLVSLLKGRFDHPPALRFRGTVGQRRPATEEEQQRWYRGVGILLRTKGGKMLWSRPGRVREVKFHAAQAVRLAGMTRHLDSWLTPAEAPRELQA
jgi:hypothetical protein